MSSRAVIVATLALAIGSIALGATDECPQEPSSVPTAQVAAASDLTSLFETPAEVTVTANGMMVATAPMHLVMLARIGPDGKIVMQCIGTAEAAETFLRKTRAADAHEPQEK